VAEEGQGQRRRNTILTPLSCQDQDVSVAFRVPVDKPLCAPGGTTWNDLLSAIAAA
jgi:hypothetical protein